MSQSNQDKTETQTKFKSGTEYIKKLLDIRNRLVYISKNCRFKDDSSQSLISSSIANAGRIQQLTQEREKYQSQIKHLEKQNVMLKQMVKNIEHQLNSVINNLNTNQPEYQKEKDSNIGAVINSASKNSTDATQQTNQESQDVEPIQSK